MSLIFYLNRVGSGSDQSDSTRLIIFFEVICDFVLIKTQIYIIHYLKNIEIINKYLVISHRSGWVDS
jgi:hypothetical protein